MRFGIDSSGNYGYIKAGADSVTPFKSGAEKITDFYQKVGSATETGSSNYITVDYTSQAAGRKPKLILLFQLGYEKYNNDNVGIVICYDYERMQYFAENNYGTPRVSFGNITEEPSTTTFDFSLIAYAKNLIYTIGVYFEAK